MLNSEGYYKYYQQFEKRFGGIEYKGISIAKCLQVPLYYFIRELLNEGEQGRIKYNLECIKNIIRPYVWKRRIEKTGMISNASLSRIKMKKNQFETKRIENKIVFLIQGISISAIKTLSNVWGLMKRKDYAVLSRNSIYSIIENKVGNIINYELLANIRTIAKEYPEIIDKVKLIMNSEHNNVFSKKRFYYWLKANILNVVHIINCLEKIIEMLPLAIVTEDDTKPEGKILALLARKRNIKSFIIQHSMAMGDWNLSRLPVTSDYTFVYGEKDKEWYLERGVPLSKIKITGQPRYDDIINGKALSREEFAKKLGIQMNDYNIVLATNPIGRSRNRRLVETCLEGIRKTGIKVNTIIKIHPSESKKAYRFVKDEKNVIIVSANEEVSLLDTLKNANIVVTYYSNVGLEALLLGKPLIVVNPFNEKNPSDYSDAGVGMSAKNSDEINDAIKSVIEDKEHMEMIKDKTEEYLINKIANRDGTASKKVCDLILKEVGK